MNVRESTFDLQEMLHSSNLNGYHVIQKKKIIYQDVVSGDWRLYFYGQRDPSN